MPPLTETKTGAARAFSVSGEQGALQCLQANRVSGTATAFSAQGLRTGGQERYGEARIWAEATIQQHLIPKREEGSIGLYFYNARWYDAVLGRFVQADTLVPQAGNLYALKWYSQVYNNAVKLIDPSGYAPLGHACRNGWPAVAQGCQWMPRAARAAPCARHILSFSRGSSSSKPSRCSTPCTTRSSSSSSSG